MTIEQDIQAAIEKQLPGEVGNVLKKRLEQAEKDAAKVVELQKLLEVSNAEGQRRGTELSKHIAIDARLAHVEEVEAQLKEREIRQELNELRVSLAAARLQDMKELVQAVFANNRYKYTEHESASVPMTPSATGLYPTQQAETRNKTIEGEG